MKFIELTKGKRAIVDVEDYETLNQYHWYFDRYATRNENGTKVLMHRQIMGTPKDRETDHSNGSVLDNRKSNLRICTKRQNQANRKKSLNKSSHFKGVTWDQKSNKWRCQITIKKRNICIGWFEEERHAALAYDLNAPLLFQGFAKLNSISAG